MRSITQLATLAIIITLLATRGVAAQSPPDIWRDFARGVDIGSELNVQLTDGQRFRATLVGVREDAVLLQPKTRVPVPIQPVFFDDIARLERAKGGVGAGKAAVIGVGAGVGAFLTMLVALLAVVGD